MTSLNSRTPQLSSRGRAARRADPAATESALATTIRFSNRLLLRGRRCTNPVVAAIRVRRRRPRRAERLVRENTAFRCRLRKKAHAFGFVLQHLHLQIDDLLLLAAPFVEYLPQLFHARLDFLQLGRSLLHVLIEIRAE